MPSPLGVATPSCGCGNPIPDLDLRGVALYAPTESALREAFPGGAEEALAAGAELVVVTHGAERSSAWSEAGRYRAGAFGLGDEVVSTLGAGDVFHGALLAELVKGRTIADAMEAANMCDRAAQVRAFAAQPSLQEGATIRCVLRRSFVRYEVRIPSARPSVLPAGLLMLAGQPSF